MLHFLGGCIISSLLQFAVILYFSFYTLLSQVILPLSAIKDTFLYRKVVFAQQKHFGYCVAE